MGRLLGSAAIAAGVAIGFAAAPAGASGEAGLAPPNARGSATPGTGATTPGAERPRLVMLINGDRLLAGAVPGGGISHELIAGTARGVNAALVSMRLGGRIYVLPADAVPYLGRGLNADLFDVGRLLRDQVHGRLPVEVRYAGRVPSLPGVTITSARDGAARGYLTAASARTFGAGLAAQFIADHARGSYGQDGLFAGHVSISLPPGGARDGQHSGRPGTSPWGRSPLPGPTWPANPIPGI
jgi:hypothetical protein